MSCAGVHSLYPHGVDAVATTDGMRRRRETATSPMVSDSVRYGSRVGELVEVHRGLLAWLPPPVHAVDHAYGAGLGAHHDGVRAASSGVVGHPAQQLPVGDAGGAEEHVIATDQVFGGEDPVQVVP